MAVLFRIALSAYSTTSGIGAFDLEADGMMFDHYLFGSPSAASFSMM